MRAHAQLHTPEGKARVAANLPSPDSQAGKLARFNALKHGLFARTATYFPARPGKYPQCDGCEYLNNGCGTEHKACLRRAELFMRFQIATETGDVKLLRQLHADNQAALQAIISDMILAIARSGGPEIRSPVWFTDKEGQVRLVEVADEDGNVRPLEEVKAHPLLKHLIDFIDRNDMTLGDMGMTSREQEGQALIKGNLADQADKREALVEYQRQQAEAMQRLERLIARSGGPVLIENDRDE